MKMRFQNKFGMTGVSNEIPKQVWNDRHEFGMITVCHSRILQSKISGIPGLNKHLIQDDMGEFRNYKKLKKKQIF